MSGTATAGGMMRAAVSSSGAGSDARINLMPRDIHMLAAIGTARYLSTGQLSALFFPGRSEKVSRRRISELARQAPTAPGSSRGGGAYLRRVTGVSFEGERVELWALTSRGATAVESALGLSLAVVERALSAQFLSHQSRLSDLFVGLAMRCAARAGALPLRPGKGRRASDFPRMKLPFRWLVSEAARLPWREFDVKVGAARDRYVAPDAMLEVKGRRVFVELETGSHPITSSNPGRRGATVQKLAAYDDFLSGYEGVERKRTFYEARFGDGLAPEVLFVVESEVRAANVNAMIAEHRAAARGVSAKALVVPEAIAYFASAAGAPALEPESDPVVDEMGGLRPEEVAALHNLYVAYNGWRKSEKSAGRAVPPKPADIGVAYDALTRLRRAGGGK